MLDAKLRSNIEATIDAKKGSGMFDNNKVLQFACGQMHTLACDTGGSVWSCGMGADGRLGLDKPPPIPGRPAFMQPRFTVFTPRKIESITKEVKKIACGANFSLCLCADGTVYAWGRNDFGQLG